LLLGHTTAFCAQMVGMKESDVRTLFQMAVIQLQEKSSRTELSLEEECGASLKNEEANASMSK
jgi:hypothetical protein